VVLKKTAGFFMMEFFATKAPRHEEARRKNQREADLTYRCIIRLHNLTPFIDEETFS